VFDPKPPSFTTMVLTASPSAESPSRDGGESICKLDPTSPGADLAQLALETLTSGRQRVLQSEGGLDVARCAPAPCGSCIRTPTGGSRLDLESRVPATGWLHDDLHELR
jgi:hypothetical protein